MSSSSCGGLGSRCCTMSEWMSSRDHDTNSNKFQHYAFQNPIATGPLSAASTIDPSYPSTPIDGLAPPSIRVAEASYFAVVPKYDTPSLTYISNATVLDGEWMEDVNASSDEQGSLDAPSHPNIPVLSIPSKSLKHVEFCSSQTSGVSTLALQDSAIEKLPFDAENIHWDAAYSNSPTDVQKRDSSSLISVATLGSKESIPDTSYYCPLDFPWAPSIVSGTTKGFELQGGQMKLDNANERPAHYAQEPLSADLRGDSIQNPALRTLNPQNDGSLIEAFVSNESPKWMPDGDSMSAGIHGEGRLGPCSIKLELPSTQGPIVRPHTTTRKDLMTENHTKHTEAATLPTTTLSRCLPDANVQPGFTIFAANSNMPLVQTLPHISLIDTPDLHRSQLPALSQKAAYKLPPLRSDLDSSRNNSSLATHDPLPRVDCILQGGPFH
ncbi:uncharacterized protein EI90DRAFT_3045984 [Cantharellus anzutake]|uniref:uncharacterized protein n=1 Tax=Cantharellus anzutake TaxID=1750568 RepID=UPI0019072AED|nr:uncharacterized protein EI90DRAFT_3045984 [Cantharellus anzutake]KAF8336497.1 hypothetical protein EI90DRAFT_3045984 [Cantharellus anzutake]